MNSIAPQAVWRSEAFAEDLFDDSTSGQGRCPYCGTVYRLQAGEKAHPGAH